MDGLHLIRRVARVVSFVLASLTLAGAGYLALTERQPIVERSASMAPRIDTGDLLLVQRRVAASVIPGDVVTFAHPTIPGRTITHRVTAVAAADRSTLRVTTQGDANPAGETWTIPLHGEVGVLEHNLALPPVAVRVLDRSPLRGIALGLMCVAGLVVTLRAIWRRPSPCVLAR